MNEFYLLAVIAILVFTFGLGYMVGKDVGNNEGRIDAETRTHNGD